MEFHLILGIFRSARHRYHGFYVMHILVYVRCGWLDRRLMHREQCLDHDFHLLCRVVQQELLGYFVYATPLILVGLEAEIAKAGLLAVLDCFV